MLSCGVRGCPLASAIAALCTPFPGFSINSFGGGVPRFGSNVFPIGFVLSKLLLAITIVMVPAVGCSWGGTAIVCCVGLVLWALWVSGKVGPTTN